MSNSSKFITLLLLTVRISFGQTSTQDSVPRFDIGIKSEPEKSEIRLTLTHRYQSYNSRTKNTNDAFDTSVYSPKSAIFLPAGDKFYVHSLEGFNTSVYNSESMKLIKQIRHTFSENDSLLFKNNESSVFGYRYRDTTLNFNHFSGKPVECCLSHNGRYLWVTYYRRCFDRNAESPSAIAIIDTESDSIVRVMPSGPLPKMIATSPDNRYIAVTHWGDNTVGIIDISSDTVDNFKYIRHLTVDYRIRLSFGDSAVNRDRNCGNCLRGTVFTSDSKYLLIGKMGGKGGIAIFEIDSFGYLGTLTGSGSNLRHMVIRDTMLYISTNMSGYVQKTPVNKLIEARISNTSPTVRYNLWQSRYAGRGVRTIDVTKDGRYIFACINNQSKIVVIRSRDMRIVSKIDADAYPVGLALSPDERKLIVTSQGKQNQGGNSVMVYSISY